MFEKVSQYIGLIKSREAEFADARMDILRRPELNSKKQGSLKQKSDRRNFYDYEQNTISVQSALLFLEGFLEAKLDEVVTLDNKDKIVPYAPWLKTGSSNQNSMAVRAYRHAAEIAEKIKGSEDSLGTARAQELKNIYHLINDLRSLLEQGIDHLKIDGGENFLEALTLSVANLKTKNA